MGFNSGFKGLIKWMVDVQSQLAAVDSLGFVVLYRQSEFTVVTTHVMQAYRSSGRSKVHTRTGHQVPDGLERNGATSEQDGVSG
jgi:hypothetical protein